MIYSTRRPGNHTRPRHPPTGVQHHVRRTGLDKSKTCQLRQVARGQRGLPLQVLGQSTPTRLCRSVTTRRRKHARPLPKLSSKPTVLTGAASTCATLLSASLEGLLLVPGLPAVDKSVEERLSGQDGYARHRACCRGSHVDRRARAGGPAASGGPPKAEPGAGAGPAAPQAPRLIIGTAKFGNPNMGIQRQGFSGRHRPSTAEH